MGNETMANDLLKGIAEIAEYLGERYRRTVYLLEMGDLPAFKLRGRWYMRQSTYRSFVEDLERSRQLRAAR
jgi:hypothetical protein